jgi:S-DNA-T family DNA segregation ATPase FtsK/SpoIIIE
VKRDAIYEFQVAQITDESVPFSFIQKECVKLQAAWKGNTARKIPILPDQVDMEFLSQYVVSEGSLTIPIGVEKNSLNVHYYPFGKSYIHMILSSSTEHIGFTHDLSKFMADHCGFDVTVIDGQQSFITKDNRTITYYSTLKDFENVVNALFELVLYRNNTHKEAIEKGVEAQRFDQKVIIINSVVALKNALSKEGAEKLGLILEKGDAKYNITIIFAEQSKNLSGITFDKWYKQHMNPGDGIWVGGGITDQFNLKANKTTSEMREDMSAGFGFSLQKGKSVKVKLLNSEKENGDNDE